jgi:hypothetical protein
MVEHDYAKQRSKAAAGDLADSAVVDPAEKRKANSFENALKNTIESQPYTAVVIAFGLGWLWGRTHRLF